MKAAITIMPETERVSPMYDAARYVALLTCCRRRGESESVTELPPDVEEKLEFLRRNGVELLICGAISNEDLLTLNRHGIRVCPFVSGLWREIWEEWKASRRLRECHLLPGCAGHHRKCCENPNKRNQ